LDPYSWQEPEIPTKTTTKTQSKTMTTTKTTDTTPPPAPVKDRFAAAEYVNPNARLARIQAVRGENGASE
jgi:hypothetical protein